MNAMLVYTASSWGVAACGISDTAPTVPCRVSRTVSPVNTFSVASFSCSVMLRQVLASLDTGIFSGNQKLEVRRSQMSESVGSGWVFQLIPSRGSSLCIAFTGVLIIKYPSHQLFAVEIRGGFVGLGFHVGDIGTGPGPAEEAVRFHQRVRLVPRVVFGYPHYHAWLVSLQALFQDILELRNHLLPFLPDCSVVLYRGDQPDGSGKDRHRAHAYCGVH